MPSGDFYGGVLPRMQRAVPAGHCVPRLVMLSSGEPELVAAQVLAQRSLHLFTDDAAPGPSGACLRVGCRGRFCGGILITGCVLGCEGRLETGEPGGEVIQRSQVLVFRHSAQTAAEVGGCLPRLPGRLLVEPPGPVPGCIVEPGARTGLEGADRGVERVRQAVPQLSIAAVQLPPQPPRQRHPDRPFGRPHRQAGQIIRRPAAWPSVVIAASHARDLSSHHAR